MDPAQLDPAFPFKYLGCGDFNLMRAVRAACHCSVAIPIAMRAVAPVANSLAKLRGIARYFMCVCGYCSVCGHFLLAKGRCASCTCVQRGHALKPASQIRSST